MHKIVAAVNSMITNPGLIKRALKRNEELFFSYASFKWSIARDKEDYYLHYYPGPQTLEQLASIEIQGEYGEYVTYSTKEIKTREAKESFAELYQTIQTKLYGIDEVLDYIINTPA